MFRAPTRYFVPITICVAALVLLAFILRPTRGPDPDPTITTKMHLLQITSASESYQNMYGQWPTGLAQFYPEGNSHHIAFLPSGPWTTNDAWGHPLVYRPFDPGSGYGAVVSLGRDGKPGGVGRDGDIEERFR
jgi:hypothetical protein